MAKASKTVIKSIEEQLARLDLQTTSLNQADDVFLALLDDSEPDNKTTAQSKLKSFFIYFLHMVKKTWLFIE